MNKHRLTLFQTERKNFQFYVGFFPSIVDIFHLTENGRKIYLCYSICERPKVGQFEYRRNCSR